jgi:hypothetical protein
MFSLLCFLVFAFLIHCSIKTKSFTMFFVLAVPAWLLFYMVFTSQFLNNKLVFSEGDIVFIALYVFFCKILLVIKGIKIVIQWLAKKPQ